MAKVIEVDSYSIKFDNGYQLYSEHETSCCESHYLDFSDIKLDDFDKLEFNLDGDSFFKRIDGYGIELTPIKGHSVKIPGYGYNNGYYSSNLTLVLETDNGLKLLILVNVKIGDDNMNIKLIIKEDSEGSPIHDLSINGKDAAYIQSLYDCAEDAIIGRSLIDAHDIINYIKMGYEAGKNGEEITVNIIEEDDN